MKYIILLFTFLSFALLVNAQTYNYEYDENGNMTYDGLNGTRIEYSSYLNLPVKIIKGNDTIEHIYDASGKKHATKKNGKYIRHYVGSFVYNGDMEIEHVIIPGGTAVPDGKGGFNYQYHHTDHLGNVRAVTDQNGTVIQQNDYYPFGLTHSPEVANIDKNKYLYNGKELQNIDGVNIGTYDYAARSYDPKIGRMHEPDPLMEKYYSISPYAYVANNPLKFIDPNGKDIVIYYGKNQNQTFRYTGRETNLPDDRFVRQVVEAYNYNVGNGGGRSMRTIAESPNLQMNLGEAEYGNTHFQSTVNWNPNIGVLVDGKYILSAATGLEHEASHSLQYQTIGDEQYYKNTKYDGTPYNNKEEYRVIKGDELQTAIANGELPKNHNGRNNHHDPYIVTMGVTAVKEFWKPLTDFFLRNYEREMNKLRNQE